MEEDSCRGVERFRKVGLFWICFFFSTISETTLLIPEPSSSYSIFHSSSIPSLLLLLSTRPPSSLRPVSFSTQRFACSGEANLTQTMPRAPPVRGSRGRSRERMVPWEERWWRRRGVGVSGLRWVMRIAVGWGWEEEDDSLGRSDSGDSGASGFVMLVGTLRREKENILRKRGE